MLEKRELLNCSQIDNFEQVKKPANYILRHCNKVSSIQLQNSMFSEVCLLNSVKKNFFLAFCQVIGLSIERSPLTEIKYFDKKTLSVDAINIKGFYD